VAVTAELIPPQPQHQRLILSTGSGIVTPGWTLPSNAPPERDDISHAYLVFRSKRAMGCAMYAIGSFFHIGLKLLALPGQASFGEYKHPGAIEENRG
jgi:hypothetical protein